jgi:hypothetical protein
MGMLKKRKKKEKDIFKEFLVHRDKAEYLSCLYFTHRSE